MLRPFLAAVVLTALSAIVVAQQPVPATQGSEDAARWSKLLQRLADADFAVRSAAQQELEKTTWRDLQRLRTEAKAASDPEVKSRLEAQVGAVETDIACNPPPFSIDLENVSFAAMVKSLSKAIDVPLESTPEFGGGENMAIALHAHDKPFWEIFRDISAQRAMQLDSGSGHLTLRASGNFLARNMIIMGPVAVAPLSVNRSEHINLQAAPGAEIQPPITTLSAIAMLDPRLRLSGVMWAVFTSVKDDAGNVLFEFNGPLPRNRNLFDKSNAVLNFSTALRMPANAGKRIALAKGSVLYTVAVSQEIVEVTDAHTKEGQTIKIGQDRVRLEKLTVSGSNMTVSIARLGRKAADGTLSNDPVGIEAFDQQGRGIWSTLLLDGSTYSVVGAMEPLTSVKLRLTLATKTKDQTQDFEFKDLPLSR